MILHRYTVLVAAATLLLIVAGALVTSTGSGLAVPDWPTSYGYSMFTFPLSYMVGGIFYEHGHRLIASSVGLLTIGLTLWIWRVDSRAWVRWIAAAALGSVILQGTLGGLTVLFFLPAPISIAHAGLAQLFFCLVVSLTVFTSPGWIEGYGPPEAGHDDRHGESQDSPYDSQGLRRLAIATTAIVYVEILLGATMRHTGAGLAIPDVPLAFGHLLPPSWSTPIAIHFAHRLGALAVAGLVVSLALSIRRHHRGRRELVRPTGVLVMLVVAQMTLGALTVLSRKAVDVNSAHVAVGALVLATSLIITLRAHRSRFAMATLKGRPTSSLAVGRAFGLSSDHPERDGASVCSP